MNEEIVRTIVVKKKTYKLSQRFACDVLSVSGQEIPDTDAVGNVLLMIKVISNSLFATYKSVSWWNITEKLKYLKFRKNPVVFLMNNLNMQEVTKSFLDIMEVEGTPVKKNLTQ